MHFEIIDQNKFFSPTLEKELNDDMYLLLIQECKDIFQKSDKIDILNAKKGDLNFLNEY